MTIRSLPFRMKRFRFEGDGRTPRLAYEPLVARHADTLFSALADGISYAYIDDPVPASHEALAQRFAELERGAPLDRVERWLNWAVLLRDTDTCIGTLQATIAPGFASIGYVLAPIYWRQGYGREACGWLVRRLWHTWRVNEIRARVDSRNIASRRLLESLSFAATGRESVLLHGRPATDILYARPGSLHGNADAGLTSLDDEPPAE
jgi:[ribosomal protein S5]-alanine N-acetyltransferase